MLLSAVQESKALLSIKFTPSGITIVERLEQSLNVELYIALTLEFGPNVMLSRLAHFWKVAPPRFVTELGIAILTILVQL